MKRLLALTFLLLLLLLISCKGNELSKVPPEEKGGIHIGEDSIKITTAYGKTILLENNHTPTAKDYCIYDFESFYENIVAILIKNSYWEGTTYTLYGINEELSYTFPGIPHFSPDRRMVVVTQSITHIKAGITIYLFDDEPSIIFDVEELDYYPQDPKWLSNSEIEFSKKIIVDFEKDEYSYEKGSIVKVDGKWEIR